MKQERVSLKLWMPSDVRRLLGDSFSFAFVCWIPFNGLSLHMYCKRHVVMFAKELYSGGDACDPDLNCPVIAII